MHFDLAELSVNLFTFYHAYSLHYFNQYFILLPFLQIVEVSE